MKAIATIQFKALPGRRFKVVNAQSGCSVPVGEGNDDLRLRCSLFKERCCDIGGSPYCTEAHVVYVEEPPK